MARSVLDRAVRRSFIGRRLPIGKATCLVRDQGIDGSNPPTQVANETQRHWRRRGLRPGVADGFGFADAFAVMWSERPGRQGQISRLRLPPWRPRPLAHAECLGVPTKAPTRSWLRHPWAAAGDPATRTATLPHVPR